MRSLEFELRRNQPAICRSIMDAAGVRVSAPSLYTYSLETGGRWRRTLRGLHIRLSNGLHSQRRRLGAM